VYTLIALDPDVASHNALEFAGTDDITAIDKEGKELPHYDQFKEYFKIARDGRVSVNKQLDRNLFAVMRINVLVTDSTAPNVQQVGIIHIKEEFVILIIMYNFLGSRIADHTDH